MARVHRVTHPIIGLASWSEIKAATEVTGRKICWWCHSDVPKGLRTRCGKSECAEMIWRVSSWARCAQVALRSAGRKCQCGAGATEVDHIVPVSLGGSGDQSNLRAMCHDCHRAATAKLRREKKEYVAA